MTPKDPPDRKRRNYSNNDGVTNTVIFHAIEELKDQIAAMNDRFNALPDTFTPRREAAEITDRLRDRQSDAERRVTELEQWRLQQMAAQHQAEIVALQQAGQIGTTATNQIANAQLAATAQIAGGRTQQDDRLINTLFTVLITVGATVLGFVLSHFIK